MSISNNSFFFISLLNIYYDKIIFIVTYLDLNNKLISRILNKTIHHSKFIISIFIYYF